MQEFYLLPFVLAYLYSSNNVKIDVKGEITKLPIPSMHTKASMLCTAIVVGYLLMNTSSQTVNHLLIVLSWLCGAHLARCVFQQTHIEAKDLIYPLFASSFLLAIYNKPSLQKHMIPLYIAHAVTLLSFIKGDVLTPVNAFDTILLSHFAFYITK